MATQTLTQMASGTDPATRHHSAAGGRAARLRFVSHGARIEVRTDDPGLLRRIREVLPPGSREVAIDRAQAPDMTYSLRATGEAVDGVRYTVYREDEVLLEDTAPAHAVIVLRDALHYGVALHSRTRLFLHAGAVEWRGRVLVLPGSSQAGKSAMVEALIRLGASYFSDECAPVDDRGRVAPYRKPLRLRPDHPRHAVETPVIGARPPAEEQGRPVGLILFQQFREDAVWQPQRLSAGAAMLRLARHTIVARHEPERTLSGLEPLVAGAPAYVTDRPEADRVARAALDLLEEHLREPSKGAASFTQEPRETR